jgi:cytochrome c553
MNRKIVVVLALLALVVGMTAVLAFAHGDMPDVIVIDKAQAKKPPVTLQHEQHGEEFGCQACHHTETADAEPESCFNCHGKDPDIPDPSAPSTSHARGATRRKPRGPPNARSATYLNKRFWPS